MRGISVFLLMLFVLPIFGCSHPLEVKNLNKYQVSSFNTLSNNLSVGIVTPNDANSGQMLVTGTAESLGNYVGRIVYPYSASQMGMVDIVSKMTVKSRHKGSGANFFINFPGFLIWTSAWNGFVYKPAYDVDIELVNTLDGNIIDSFSIPIDLNVRHAEFDRTWTQITWLESGIIGFIGGLVFISYDDDVTPLLESEIKKPIGDYIAQEISKRLQNSSAYQAIVKKKLGVSQIKPTIDSSVVF